MNSIPISENKSHDRQHDLQTAIQSRYAWLLRWALHFTENNRDAAEDLVQETFVRLLLAWDTLHNHDDLEPLLYSYLRYTHLSEQRRMQKQAFQRLSSADFDTLAISLHNSAQLDQIEVQNELRSILDFLLWRRHSARFASIFLLRFFHGYFPEEIASICVSKRFAVDIGLRQARRELKTYLADPHRLRVLRRNPVPEPNQHSIVMPVDQFENEIRNRIFHSSQHACPAPELFDRIYSPLNKHSIETAMIAHIVSCEQCLDRATQSCGAPPPSRRSMDESLSRAPRGGSKSASSSEKQRLARIFAAGESRRREIYDHHPAEMMIALNAEVTAVRDIPPNATRATLKVETHAIDKLELIEVVSELGLPLLSMPLLDRPPKSQPEIQTAVLLSGDRMLTLVVRFTRDGALIEATYQDPHGAEALDDARPLELIGPIHSFAEPADVEAAPSGRKTSWWSTLLDSIYRRIFTAQILAPATAILAGVALLVTLTVEERQRERVDVNQLLRAAAHAEIIRPAAIGPAVVIQQIEIKATGKTLRRTLYRDAAGRRQPKEQQLNEDERILRARLAEAKLDWNNLLSAESFRDWHDHLYREEDRIAKSGAGLLTVSTTAAEGAVSEEKFTVQADNFHAVARSIRFRSGETIEIAELHYDTVPWSPQMEQWFEPIAGSSPIGSFPTAAVQPVAALPLSDAQLDIAELSAHLTLQQLHADTERLDVSRTTKGISVKGIVESDERKAELTAHLHTIPHVITAISSYRDLKTSASTQQVSQLNQVSVSESATPLRDQCAQKHILTDTCREISYTLLNAATVCLRESKRLHELQLEFPATKPLTVTAQSLFAAIVRERIHHIDAALEDERHALELLGEESQDTENQPSDSPFLEDAAQHNLVISQELLYNTNEHPRPAQIILHELAESLRATRAATIHETADFQARIDTSSFDAARKQ